MDNNISRRAILGAAGLLVSAAAAGAAGQVAQAAPAQAAFAPATVSAGSAQSAIAVRGDLRVGARGAAVTAIQTRFNQLGYSVGRPTGYYGPRTRQAVMALQKVAGLPRTGVYDARTSRQLALGTKPRARSTRGHIIEVDKGRQILMVVDNGRVTKIFNVSTGSGKRFYEGGHWNVATTPSGTFHFWTEYNGGRGWQHGKLGDMYRPMYFNHGIAVHGSKFDIGAYPSSHGCVRIFNDNLDELRDSHGIYLGGTVLVY